MKKHDVLLKKGDANGIKRGLVEHIFKCPYCNHIIVINAYTDSEEVITKCGQCQASVHVLIQ